MDSPIFKDLGEELRSYRGNRTQEEFAKLLRVSVAAYGNYERGQREVSVTVLRHAKDLRPAAGINKDRETEVVHEHEPAYITDPEEWEDLPGGIKQRKGAKQFMILGPAPALGEAVQMLQTVLSSGNQGYIQAIMSNLVAISSAIETARQQAQRISKLEADCERFERRLSELEAPERPPRPPRKLDAQGAPGET